MAQLPLRLGAERGGRPRGRKSAPSVTRILLDWDDTLFFTSALGRNTS